MPRYRAIIEYDGTAYQGFQRQRQGQPTIQGELERALTLLARQPVVLTGAGRTDTGVHAQGQVVSFVVDWHHRTIALQHALNANLADDIAVLQLEVVDTEFHPRYDAQRRAYVYHIYNGLIRRPLYRLRSWHVKRPLNLELMNAAASVLIGKHDFATFGQPPQGVNTVREIFQVECYRQGEMIFLTIEANAFLYRMVRSIVGSLKLVGEMSWTVADFVGAFEACDRSRSGSVAPAQGLHLVSVTYKK